MSSGDDHLTAYYASLTNAELLERCSHELTEVARNIAAAEIRLRGLEPPEEAASTAPADSEADAATDVGDEQVIVAHDLSPTAAALIRDYLGNNGLRAVVTDANFGNLFGGALTGANVRVAKTDEHAAREMIAAFEAGSHDDADAESPPPDNADAAVEDTRIESPRRLRTFRRYQHPSGNKIMIVKEGFSWGAFIFGPLWFLVHRLWFVALVTTALSIGGQTFFVSRLISGRGAALYWLFGLAYWALWILIGRIANGLLCAEIEARGYVLDSVVRAANATDARYESSCVTTSNEQAPPA